mgnify:CR=1 FL=1
MMLGGGGRGGGTWEAYFCIRMCGEGGLTFFCHFVGLWHCCVVVVRVSTWSQAVPMP